MDADHPLIPNPREYAMVTNLVSVHSVDRDMVRYPNAAEFAIELPQNYKNVISAKLSSWSFPAIYDAFSYEQGNILLVFQLTEIYAGVARDPAVAARLQGLVGQEQYIEIDRGFYTPDQMAAELTALLNERMGDDYSEFAVVYNEVEQRLWFANSCDAFLLKNDSVLYQRQIQMTEEICSRGRGLLPQEAEWGLPYNLGFTRCPAASEGFTSIRFRHSSTGPWISPLGPDVFVQCVIPPAKVNMMGPAYMYMEIAEMNCMDETSPFSVSAFTTHSNQTAGVVNSAFAKIAIPATPVQQWFDSGAASYKFYTPPKECIRRLTIKFRYHNGRLVDFGSFPYSFTLEINTLSPSPQRGYNIRSPYDQGQIQSI